MLGTVWGFYWYRQQLASGLYPFWIFIPDSPTATLLFSLFLILKLMKKKYTLLGAVSCVWLIKYGIWAVVINLDLVDEGSFGFENFHLALSHLGMALEGLIFLNYLRISVITSVLVIGLMVISDYVDYGLGQHPYLFLQEQYPTALFTAVFLTLIIAVVLMFKAHRKQSR